MQDKYKGLNPNKVLSEIFKRSSNTGEVKHHQRNKIHIENIRHRAKNLIDSQIKILKNSKIAEESKT